MNRLDRSRRRTTAWPTSAVGRFIRKAKDNKLTILVAALGASLAFLVGLINNAQTLTGFLQSEDGRLAQKVDKEVQDILHGKWRTVCMFEVPENWDLGLDFGLGDITDEKIWIGPQPGTALDKAGFGLNVSGTSGSRRESEFYQKELFTEGSKDRGFILTPIDQFEALGNRGHYPPKTLEIIDEIDLRFKVVQEDGIEVMTEPVEIVRDVERNFFMIQAMVQPTITSETTAFKGYINFECTASAQIAKESFAELCLTLIERSLLSQSFSDYKTTCRESTNRSAAHEAEIFSP